MRILGFRGTGQGLMVIEYRVSYPSAAITSIGSGRLLPSASKTLLQNPVALSTSSVLCFKRRPSIDPMARFRPFLFSVGQKATFMSMHNQ